MSEASDRTASRSHRASAVLAICALAAAGETALLLADAKLPDPLLAGLAFLAFLIGPFAFLALAAWRRRAIPARVTSLLIVSLIVASLGLTAFALRTVVSAEVQKNPALNPAVVPLLQWLVVLAIWFRINAIEAREKRRQPSR